MLLCIEDRAEHVLLSGDINMCRDDDDDLIIETAIKGNAEYLISRDGDVKGDSKVIDFLLQAGITVISVDKFLSLYNLKCNYSACTS